MVGGFAPPPFFSGDSIAKKLISRFLDEVGDGSGNHNANGNYLAVPQDFIITPDEGEYMHIMRMIVSIEDTQGFQAEEYGNLGAALTNGVVVAVHDQDGVLYPLTDPNNGIDHNAGWAHYAYDTRLLTWGAGNETLVTRWTFQAMGHPLVLRSQRGEKLVVTLNDNLTGLVEHLFLVQGHEEQEV